MSSTLDTSEGPCSSLRKFILVSLPWIICGLGAAFYFYEYFLRIAPSVMTGDLMRTYGIHAAALGNLTAFYYYAYAPMQLPVGVLMDRYGPRRLLTLSCLCCVIGTYMFAATDILLVAQIGRFLVGFGSAFAFVGVLKLATVWLPPEHFAVVSGLTTTLGMIGAMVGDIALADLVEKYDWQFSIYLSAAFGIALTALIWGIVRDSPDKKSLKKTQTTTMRGAILGLLKVVESPQVWLAGTIGFFMFLPTSAFAELWGVPYLKQVFGFSEREAATAISMIFLGWAVGAPLFGWFSDKFRLRKLPITAGALLAACSITILFYAPTLSSSLVFTLLFLFGLFSSAEIIIFAIATEATPTRFAGSAIAIANMVVMIGGIVFQPLIGYLLDSGWSGMMEEGVHVFTKSEFQSAFVVIPVGLFLAVLLTFFIKETHASHSASP